jgi:mitochondrial fission protein ELM1
VRPAETKNPDEGLMLIGGPEREHPWVPDRLEAQITAIARRHRDIQWCAASSRRTPMDFLPQLRKLQLANLHTVAVEDVDADWLPQKLATASTVWVTEDSVNMLYEALTAGAATGLVSMPHRDHRESKRNLGGGLLAEGLVTSFEDWQKGRDLEPPPEPLDEAGRCADWILDEWQARAR